MSWRALTRTDVYSEGLLAPAEQSSLKNAAGNSDGPADAIVASRVAWARGIISISGIDLGEPDTIPDSVRPEVIALIRWDWLLAFPKLSYLQTAYREKAWERALDVFDKIAELERAVEGASGSANEQGNASSDTFIPGRMNLT